MAMVFEKNCVSKREFELLKKAYDNGIPTSKPLDYEPETLTLKMEKISGMSLADFYGDTPEGLREIITSGAMDKVKEIVKNLKEIGIIYPDITGYNFMINSETEEIYVIDFGHAFELNQEQFNHVLFVKEFISGRHTPIWNPNFK